MAKAKAKAKRKRRKSKPIPRPQAWAGLSQSEWDYAERYMKRCADLLDLHDWDLQLQTVPVASEKTLAKCFPTFGRRYAVIELNSDWATYGRATKRRVIAHELIHCHLETVWGMMIDDLAKELSGSAHTLFAQAMKRQIELVVDTLAVIVAKWLPEYRHGWRND